MATEGGAAKKMMVGKHPMSPIGNTAAVFDVDGGERGGGSVDVAAIRANAERNLEAGIHWADIGVIRLAKETLAVLAALAAAEGERDKATEQLAFAKGLIDELCTELEATQRERDELRRACALGLKGIERVNSLGEGRVYADLLDVAHELRAALTGPPEAHPPQEAK